MIDDLLAQAGDLVGRGVGRPRSVDLRRAASAAYYAVFHALARLVATQRVGWAKPWSVIASIYRSLDHRKARDVLNAFRKDGPGTPLASIAVAFAVLQDARHEADYNPEPFRFARGGTLDLIGNARRAVAQLDALSADLKLALAVRLIERSR